MSDAKSPAAASFSAKPDDADSSRSSPKGPAPKDAPPADFFRETVESVVIAFVLAFLFRTFVAEAFVIPTGSMAVTLMGRHKDVECANCGFWYQASASREADESGAVHPNIRVVETICPNCGFPMNTKDDTRHQSYRGDRIIVSKFGVRDPERWSVIVFRFPEQAGTNYIKRLVGLPGEQIRIFNGDLFVRPLKDAQGPFRILRKPPDVVLAMLREVYNNDYIVDWMTDAGWPPRWQPCPMDIASLVNAGWRPGRGDHKASLWTWPPTSEPTESKGWKSTDGYRSFSIDGTAGRMAWLRYQHLLPSEPAVWGDELLKSAPDEVRKRASISASQRENLPGRPSAEVLEKPLPLLVGDFTAYNFFGIGSNDPKDTRIGREWPEGDRIAWVGDLAVECEITPKNPQGTVVLELVEAKHRFRCHLNLQNRDIRLSIDEGQRSFDGSGGRPGQSSAVAQDALPSDGTFKVMFANVDSRLLVWIDGDLVEFSTPTEYELNDISQTTNEASDLSPVGIASDAATVRVDKLRVFRDVYYVYYRGASAEHPRHEPPLNGTGSDADVYRLESDQFFVLGDNSQASSDARAWENNYVQRKLLIGKALFIYWPHSWDTPLPFTPNFQRMGFIR